MDSYAFRHMVRAALVPGTSNVYDLVRFRELRGDVEGLWNQLQRKKLEGSMPKRKARK